MKIPSKTVRKKNGGTVLILALVFMLMLAVISTTAMHTALLQLHMAGNDQFLEEAFHKAEAIVDELSQSPDNFVLDTQVGHSNCPLDPKILDCELRLLAVPASVATSEGYDIDYRITRQDPVLWLDFPISESQATASSSRNFDAAIFEVDVRVDGSSKRRGSAHVVQGVAVRALPVGNLISPPGEGIDLYDMDGDGASNISTLLLSHARTLYRTYWREPGIDPL